AAPVADASDDRRGKLPPAVFYGGLGASVVLLALTTWSGLDTFAEKNKRYSDPAGYDQDTVFGKAHRSDALFGATVIVSAVTAYIGFKLVDWKKSDAPTSPQMGMSVHATPYGG